MQILNEIDSLIYQFERPIEVTTYEGSDMAYQYQFDTRKEIALITFMSASKYITGESDELGEKPFYNIVNQIVDLEVRATDLDTKNIILRPDSPEYEVHALLKTKMLHKWFTDNKFASTLNDFGEIGARYGNVLLKRWYDDGKIKIGVCNWLAMTFDQFDIEKGAKIETHFMTALDLEKKRGVWDDEAIDEAIYIISKRQKEEDEKERNTRDIEVLEVEAELPRSVFTQDQDTDGFSLQHYFVIRGEGKKGIILFQEELKETNYKYYGRKKLLGRGWALGVVESGKEAQGQVNMIKIFERRALELGSLNLFWTDDEELEDNNVIRDKKTGDIIYTAPGKKFQQASTLSNALPQYQVSQQSWEQQFKSSNSAFDAVTGENLPSGTAYRLGLLQAKQASSIFEYLRERKGEVIQSVVEDWILPELDKGIDKKFILEAGFSAKEIDMIHSRYAAYVANQKLVKLIEEGKDLDILKTTYEEVMDTVRQSLPEGEIQFLDVTREMMKEANKHIKVVITDEAEDVEAKIATLNSLLQIAQQDQNNTIFPPDAVREIVQEISRLANLSTIEYGLAYPNKPSTPTDITSPIAPIQTNATPNEQAL